MGEDETVMTTSMPTERYTIPVNETLIGVLSQVMPDVTFWTSIPVEGPEPLPAIFFRAFGGSSVSNAPTGRQTAASYQVQFDCMHQSAEEAELLADWLYASLERLVDPNIPGHEVIVHNDCWITSVEESELPSLSTTTYTARNTQYMANAEASFTVTLRRLR